MAYSDNQAGVVEERFLTRPNYRAVTGTSDTLTTVDVDDIITYNNASAIAVTLPAAATFVAPVGTVITVIATGAGTVTVTRASSSDTINGGASATVTTGVAKRLMKVAESSGNSTWLLY